MPAWAVLVGVLLLIVACAVFVAAEFSLLTVDRARVEEAAAAGDQRSTGVLKSLTSLSTQLSGAQLGITVTNLAIGFLAEPAVSAFVAPPLLRAGVSPSAVPPIAVATGLIFATILTMIFGELLPKNIAIANPWRTVRIVAGPQRWFTTATSWVIRLLNGCANATLRLFGVEPSEELASARSADELVALVRHSVREGTLDRGTADLVTRAISFGALNARDVLTPRVRVRFVTATATVSAVLSASRETGYSRFPVTGLDGLDDIVGVVHVKQAIAVPRNQRDQVRVSSVMTQPLLVPATLLLDPLLPQLRGEPTQLAIVLDEYGGTAGIVTLEDLLEEIIGAVSGEHDQAEQPSEQLNDGSWVVSAMLRPDEATRLTGVELPDGGKYESLAGLLAGLLERVPKPGDRVDVGRAVLSVIRMDGRRVDRVLIFQTCSTT